MKYNPGNGFNRSVLILFEITGETLEAEREEIRRLALIALTVKADPEYKTLKNSRQREIHLLVRHSLTKSESETVIELLKDEMDGTLRHAVRGDVQT